MGIASEKHRGQITEESFKSMLAKLDADGNGKVTKVRPARARPGTHAACARERHQQRQSDRAGVSEVTR